MNINFIGNIFGSTGYSVHSRQLFNSLAKKINTIHLDTQLMNGWELLCNDNELKAIKNSKYSDGITIMIATPDYWKLGLLEKHSKFYGFCVWEGDKVPRHFYDGLSSVTGILVPSTHVKTAILNTFPKLKTPIYIVPHGINPEDFKGIENKNSKFTFIANKGWSQGMNDRGGIQFLLKAFSEEFSKEENVQLNIKINPSYCNSNWNLNQELSNLKLPENKADININAANIEYKDIRYFYEGDCFVSPNMSEAFGLTIAEGMSAGMPVITTNFGGQTDFVTSETGWLIDYDLIENKWDYNYEGINWAIPKVDHLRQLLRYAYEHRDECREKGKKAQEHINNNYTWDISADILLEIIK